MEWNNIFRDEINHCLHEFGISCQHNKEHVSFRRQILERAEHVTKQKVRLKIDFSDLKNESFPANVVEAIKFAFQKDIEETPRSLSLYNCDDNLISHLDEDTTVEPFYRQYEKHNNKKTKRVIGYGRRKEYKQFTINELDPFNRFDFTTCTHSEKMFLNWYSSSKDEDYGTIYEAVLACHALQYESCYHCKHTNTLRWNGGGMDTPWQDLVCIHCHSMYEIKTKKNLDRIEKEFFFNRLNGGSFNAYCELRNSLCSSSDQKMFLVVLPREFIRNTKGEHVHPVFIAEIDTILPQVTLGAFNPERSFTDIYFSSKIKIKKSTKCKWFDLPNPPKVDYMSILDELFINRFSLEEFQRLFIDEFGIDDFREWVTKDCTGDITLKSKLLESINCNQDQGKEDVEGMDAIVSNANDNKESSAVKDIKTSLEDLQVGDADCDVWDDLYE